jgi:hypothetical protein
METEAWTGPQVGDVVQTSRGEIIKSGDLVAPTQQLFSKV